MFLFVETLFGMMLFGKFVSAVACNLRHSFKESPNIVSGRWADTIVYCVAITSRSLGTSSLLRIVTSYSTAINVISVYCL